MKLIFIFFSFILITTTSYSKKPRIGTFDSRGVAIAYYQSQYHQNDLNKMLADYNQALDSGDTILTKKLSDRVKFFEMIAHDKGFGKGTVNNILDKFKKELDELAKKEKLSGIISKWEVFSKGKDIEFVDITDKVVSIINPSEKVKKYLEGLDKLAPIEDAFFIEE